MINNNSVELIAFYNVENLFLPDPPSKHKSDPTVSGLRNWNEYKYRHKISNIAKVFQLITESEGATPLIIGLAEISGQKPLEDLINNKPFENYKIVQYDSHAKRGIGVALLYDAEKIQLISSETLSYNFPDDINENDDSDHREILHCRFTYSGEIINVFVVHLPSRREKNINGEKRAYIVEKFREKLHEIVKRGEATLICGDFNANPDEDIIKKLLYDDQDNKIFTNPFAELFAGKIFSTYHRGDGLLFDQLILSERFYGTDFPLKYRTAKVFDHESLKQRDGKFSARPARTFAGSRYIGGYSDHFPVLIQFSRL